MFGLHITTLKVKPTTNSISSSGAPMENKTCSQEKRNQRGRKLQAHMELITQQQWGIGNLKVTQASGVILQQSITAILQVMSCLYVGNKKTPSDNQSNGGSKFAGIPRPPKPSLGIDGSLDTTLICWYCKDTGHELDNCKQLLHKLAHECTTMQDVVTEESLNTNHH